MTDTAITHGLTVGRQGTGGGEADVAIPADRSSFVPPAMASGRGRTRS
jgi:hypothetical protein